MSADEPAGLTRCPSLLDLNCSIGQLRPRPQQPAKIGASDAQFAGGVRDVDAMSAENLNHHIRVKMSNAVRNLGDGMEAAHAHVSPRSFSNCAILARRATRSERLSASSILARPSKPRPGRAWTRNGHSPFNRASRGGAVTVWRFSVRTDCER